MKEKYIIDKEKRVIVCILERCKYDAVEGIDKHSGIPSLTTYSEPFLMKNTYKGVAKCSVDDEWDERTGMRIAFERAYNQYKHDYQIVATKAINRVESAINNFENWASKRGYY